MQLRAVLVAAVLAASALPGSRPASAGVTPVITPSDRHTVEDLRQLTGRRVDLPVPEDCVAEKSACDATALLNQLDGFDLDPRIAVAFGQPIDVAAVTPETLYVEQVDGGARIPLNRLVWSPARNTLYGHPAELLEEATRYRLVVTPALGGTGASETFTTMSASAGLLKLRRQLDGGTAHDDAGIAEADRSLRFTIGPAGARAVFPAGAVVRIRRLRDVAPSQPLVEETVNNGNLLNVGLVAFGSFLSPSWLTEERVIPQVPTATGEPAVRGYEEVGFSLTVPAGTPPAGGWPVAVFGPGITRSKYDLFLAADQNAARGLATIAIDPVGHGWGPRSQTVVDLAAPPGSVAFSGFGRSVDLDNNGKYTDQEGVSAPGQPHRYATVALRDGLRQTALDNMALVRAIARGVDVDGNGSVDLRPTGTAYYAQSLGGIYGTMLVGVDPLVTVGALNVPGGPITEIARLSPSFRHLVAAELKNRVPPLLNGGRNGFTESLPLWADPPVTAPAVGAVPIQETLAVTDWIDRPGSPETFAPLLRLRPPEGSDPKRVLYQFALGDQTVPNPTSATIMRAGRLQDVTTVYRNDLTPTAPFNPHGFLLDPRLTGRVPAQTQITQFLTSGGTSIVDPDGPAPVFEVPVNPPGRLEALNYALPPAEGEPPPEQPRSGSERSRARGAAAGSLPATGRAGAPAAAGVALAGAVLAASVRRRARARTT